MRALDTWINSCKVTALPWIDGTHIYVNVQHYLPGQSLEQPPSWDKTVLITDSESGREFVFEFTHTLVDYIEQLIVPAGHKVVITVESPPKLLV